MGAIAWYVGFKQIRAIICAEPLHKQQSINKSVCQTNQSIWEPPRGTWALQRSGRSSVPSPCTTNNPSIGLSDKLINQYGRHHGVRGLHTQNRAIICAEPLRNQSINRSVCHTNQSIWAPSRGTWASSRSERSSVLSPCTNNNPSIGLSAKPINQYGPTAG